MRKYKINSPEAVSRIVAMALISDAELQDVEIEALDEHDFFRKVGINKAAFANVFADYCRDLTEIADVRGRIRPLEPSLIDSILTEVDDPAMQSLAMTMISRLLKADGELSIEESAVFNHIARRWQGAALARD